MSERPLSPLVLVPEFFNDIEQIAILEELSQMRYRPCPNFLGSFEYSRYSKVEQLGPFITVAVGKLCKLVPKQEFNTFFIQKYPDGSFVNNHRDPKNNIGKTIIAPFGQFTGALSRYGDIKYNAPAGSVVIQNCTMNGIQGAWHSVEKIVGERYCIILNTIVS